MYPFRFWKGGDPPPIGDFGEAYHARACVEVSRLPLGALVELDAIAKVD